MQNYKWAEDAIVETTEEISGIHVIDFNTIPVGTLVKIVSRQDGYHVRVIAGPLKGVMARNIENNAAFRRLSSKEWDDIFQGKYSQSLYKSILNSIQQTIAKIEAKVESLESLSKQAKERLGTLQIEKQEVSNTLILTELFPHVILELRNHETLLGHEIQNVQDQIDQIRFLLKGHRGLRQVLQEILANTAES